MSWIEHALDIVEKSIDGWLSYETIDEDFWCLLWEELEALPRSSDEAEPINSADRDTLLERARSKKLEAPERAQLDLMTIHALLTENWRQHAAEIDKAISLLKRARSFEWRPANRDELIRSLVLINLGINSLDRQELLAVRKKRDKVRAGRARRDEPRSKAQPDRDKVLDRYDAMDDPKRDRAGKLSQGNKAHADRIRLWLRKRNDMLDQFDESVATGKSEETAAEELAKSGGWSAECILRWASQRRNGNATS